MVVISRSVCVEGEAYTLEDPMTDVFCGLDVSFKHETDAHCIASLRRHVHRGTICILQQHYITSVCKHQ